MPIEITKYGPATTAGTAQTASSSGKAAPSIEETLALMREEAENRDQVLISRLEREQEKNKNSLLDMMPPAVQREYQVRVSKPSDNSGRLTQRLVSAHSEGEVSAVMAEAGSNLVNLRLVAALGSPEDAQKARAIIARLNKLIQRSSGKISDLRNEQIMKSRAKKAEQEKKNKKAEKIKHQLKQKQVARHSREGWYLRESALNRLHDDLGSLINGGDRLDAVSEAAIDAAAEAMAAAEVSIEAAAPGGDVGMDAGGGGEGVSIDAGGGASLDISV